MFPISQSHNNTFFRLPYVLAEHFDNFGQKAAKKKNWRNVWFDLSLLAWAWVGKNPQAQVGKLWENVLFGVC